MYTVIGIFLTSAFLVIAFGSWKVFAFETVSMSKFFAKVQGDSDGKDHLIESERPTFGADHGRNGLFANPANSFFSCFFYGKDHSAPPVCWQQGNKNKARNQYLSILLPTLDKFRTNGLKLIMH